MHLIPNQSNRRSTVQWYFLNLRRCPWPYNYLVDP